MSEGIRVYTESTCSKCGMVDVRDGDKGECPPADWARLTLLIRRVGGGCENIDRFVALLCPECIEEAQQEFFSKEGEKKK